MFTKGEWITEYWGHGTSIWLNDRQPQTKQIAYLPHNHGIPMNEVEANAHLISAAPIGHELAEAVLNNMPRATLEKIAMRFIDKAKIDY